MLEVKGVNLAIQRVPILRDVSFEIETGKTAGIIGRNGAGKTTVMRTIMGLAPISSGSITFDGEPLHSAKSYKRAGLGIGYLPEDRRLVPHFTVEENIQVPLWAMDQENADRIKWVYDIIPEIGRFADRKALTLSGGQQKLVALARAMVTGSKLLLLDEPFEGVAPALAQRLMEVISDLRSENLTVLVSESDYSHSEKLVDYALSIERGSVEVSQKHAA